MSYKLETDIVRQSSMSVMFALQIAFLIKYSLPNDSNNGPFIGNQVGIFGIC